MDKRGGIYMHWSFWVSVASLIISIAGLIYSTICACREEPTKKDKNNMTHKD